MTFLDYSIILLYFPVLFWIGLHISRRSSSDAADFLLAGRKVTLPIFVMTLVSTWYGGILGVGEFTYRFGISNWLVFGLPYYLWAILFALFFAEKIRKTNLKTIPELLTIRFSAKVGVLGAFFVFILVNPAPYLLILAILLSHLLHVSFWWGFFIGIFVSVVYVYVAGFRSVIFTDALQFTLMFLAFFLAFIFAVKTFGGWSFLKSTLPETHLSPLGGNTVGYIVIWFFIALWTFVDPGFHQRCYAVREPSVAKKGILISILFWALFDFLTTTVGLYARATLPEVNPVNAFPAFGELILPAGLTGLFFLGMMATVMSTVDSYTFISAMTLGNDIIGNWRKLKLLREETKTRIGIILSILIATGIVFFYRSVIDIWYTIGSLVIPSLLFPVFLSYYPFVHLRHREMMVMMISTFSINLIFLIVRLIYGEAGIFRIEPMLAGFAFSLTWVLIRFLREMPFTRRQ